jgi:hypothetical protein
MGGKDLLQGSLSQNSMTNFPPARSSQEPGLPHTIGRKIIVEHETFKLITFQRLDPLFVRGGS